MGPFFIDSWVWLEFFSKADRWQKAEECIQRLEVEQGIISALVLMEVKYILKRRVGAKRAEWVIHVIESFENLTVLPVTGECAKYAADIRDKYYRKGERELSYADAVHLATAILAGCETFYSGDPDFEGIEELVTCII